MAQRPGQAPPPPPPRIPESWLSASEQRFYVAAVAGGLQVYKLSDALFHFYRTSLSTSVAPTPSTFLSPIAIINKFLPFNLANWLPFISLDASAASTYLTKWLVWDWLVVAVVMWLRVPALRFGPVKGLVYAALFTFLDALVFGTLGVWAQAAHLLVFFGKFVTNTRGQVTTLGNRAAKPWKVVDQEQHLLGHRSIRVLPHGTALFNPLSATYCLSSGGSGFSEPVLIPVITNNSEPYKLWYTIQPLDNPGSEVKPLELMGSHLIRGDRRLLQKRLGVDGEDADDYYLDGRNAHAGHQQQQQHQGSIPPARAIAGTVGQATGDGSAAAVYHGRSIKPNDKVSSLPHSIEQSQTIYYLPVTQPGWVQLERVQDADESDFRIRKTSRQALVVECPSEGRMLGVVDGEGVGEKEGKGKAGKTLKLSLFQGDHAIVKRTASSTTVGGIHHRCVGDDDVVKMRVRGVGELQVGWLTREGKGKESKVIEEGVIRGIQLADPACVGANGPGNSLLIKDKSERAAATGSQVVLARKAKHLATDRNVPNNNFAAQTHDAFLPIPHRQPGRYEVEFLNITDQFGNFLRPPQTQSTVFEIHPLPMVSFTNYCAQPRTLRLFQNRTVSLPIIMPGARNPDGTTKVKISFKPNDGDDTATAWEKDYEMEGKGLSVPVGRPGTYSIEEANSLYCRGIVNEPATCVVEAVPVPKAEVKMESLSNECAGDTGVRGTINFVGTPPFKAAYTVQSRNGHVATKHVNSNSPIAHFSETPSSPGTYTYTMLSIGDQNYQDIPIKMEPFKQTVHPLPKLSVLNRSGRRSLWSCAQTETRVDFALSGKGPFTVDYTVSWPMDSYASQATFNQAGNQHITLKIPTAVAANGGSFTVTFTNIKDVNGCVARTNEQSVPFDVKTTRPTAKFGDTGTNRVVQVVEGSSARAVVQLTGEGPWTVEYVHSDHPEPIPYTVTTANAPLVMNRKGVYRLVGVKDAHCKGHIVEGSDSFELTYFDKPSVHLPATGARQQTGQIHSRPPICAGAEDHVTLDLEGRSPFQVRYRHVHTLPDKTKYTEDKDIVSAQDAGILHMESQPGQHKYTVLGVKDVSYDFDAKSLSSPKGVFSIVQEVFGKPTAGFAASSRFSYCVGQPFKASQENTAAIEFAGKAPFEVDLALGPPGSRPLYKKTIKNIKGNSWKVDLPDHTFSHVGSQLLTILSVRDSSGCPAEILNDDNLYLGIDVLETATITPVNDRLDYCVGDMLEFVLGGTAPWHVAYKFNKKAHDVVVNVPQFYRLAERAGDLEIKSVSNKNNKDIHRKIHPLPKAKIEEGKPWLHEGDETEITFSFKGTPPFTFTYTRSITDGRKGSKVVDTQTISDIQSNSYTFSTAMEGEYDVTYVKDTYCSYPPQPRSAESKQKLLQW
ncbi:hypothetical protein QFC21_006552 [Naganishia friedmannii]|uniref:Uncharacterized protein n=1 Tax=Naganishia friedmannii TaxID=89922 RepID=A0ACC2V224_9TREE|nr:hypothetical protein QFC21_006552 [Naganishia friedmannii]